MQIQTVSFSAPFINLAWATGEVTPFPAIFLRDNDPADLHPQTQEQLFDLSKIDLAIEPLHYLIIVVYYMAVQLLILRVASGNYSVITLIEVRSIAVFEN